MGGRLLDLIVHYIILSSRTERLATRMGRDARLEEIRRGGMLRCMMGQTSPIHGTLG